MHRLRPGSAFLIATLALSAGCADAPWPSPADEEAAMRIGGAAADTLVTTLIRHLTAALDSAGPAGAIDFCSTEALPLTRLAASSLGNVDVKRTSTRTRNPVNAPDALETEALAWFASQRESTGTLPPAWIQAEGTEALRYYRPLVANELCVRCHGPTETLSPDVLEALAQRYPEDQATGYAAGDLRGLIRVRIPRAALAADPAS